MIINYRQAVPMVREQDEHTLILLHGDSFFDSSMYERAIENYGVSISSTQSKFGGYSMSFNGNSKLLIPEGINFGSGDFTIDWWEYCTSSSNGARFTSIYTESDSPDSNYYGGLFLGYRGTDVYASDTLGQNWNVLSGAKMLSVSLSEWVHWAFVRFGTSFTSYRNGATYASVPINGSIYYDADHSMVVGGHRERDPQPFYGYIDEFRISNVARWTGNFTPPTEAYER